MFNYYFVDEDTGVNFFVVADTVEEAKEIAKAHFYQPKFYGVFSDEYAELCGFDTY